MKGFLKFLRLERSGVEEEELSVRAWSTGSVFSLAHKSMHSTFSDSEEIEKLAKVKDTVLHKARTDA